MAYKVSGKSVKQLREERAGFVATARKLHEEHADDWTADRDAQYNELMANAALAKATADRNSQLDLEAMGSEGGDTRPLPDPNERPGQKAKGATPTVSMRMLSHDGKVRYVNVPAGPRGTQEYQDAFSAFLKTGERSAALQSDDSEQAGYLLAGEQFAAELLKEVDDLVFVRRYARIHTVREANSLGIRKRTTKASTFDWSSELTISPEDTALKYGKKVLEPHHLTGSIKVSRDLLRRSVIPIDAEVRSELARDAGEKMEDAYLLGDGDRKPLGLFVPSADGISTARDVVTGSNTSFTSDGLLDAKYKLKSQYRTGQRGEVRWLFHRDGIAKIAKLKDSEGQYLLRVGMGVQQDASAPEDMLLGFPVDESERSPNTFTAGNYVGLLANYRYYEIADALDMEMQVLMELYAATNQVGYIGRLKTDGMPTLEEAFVRLKTGT